MADIIPRQLDDYRRLGAWLRDGLPRLESTDRHVWTALKSHWPSTNPPDIRAAVGFGNPPLVYVEPLSDIYGRHDRAEGDIVRIDREMVIGYEEASVSREPEITEVTVLHELLHWGWGKAGQVEKKYGKLVEIGDEFEKVAYPDGIEFSVETTAASELTPLHASTAPTTEIGRLLDIEHDQLGQLSRQCEARSNPAAFGFDGTGGWSYGLYQLAARRGTVGRFLSFLSAGGADYAGFAGKLQTAGGSEAALRGDEVFKDAWKELALESDFSRAQHDFIKKTHYDPFVMNLRADGIDLTVYKPVLQDVAWSVSVQHGPKSTNIFTRAFDALLPPERRDDAKVIDAIYTERSKVDIYFKSSSSEVQAAVVKRFAKERAAALLKV